MSSSIYLVVLVKLSLLVCFARCNDESYSDVIDLQELLKEVSATMESTKAQLNVNQFCGARQDNVCPMDCSDLLLSGKRVSGVYFVHPLGYEEPFQVFCDQTTDGGGWTVIQRRGDFGYPVDYFYKNWKEYKEGFGDLRKEFWLGNDQISALSLQRDYQLRVDLQTRGRNRAHAKYNKFWVENEQHEYQLHVSGFSGEAGDSLIDAHNLHNFSTTDRGPKVSCAETYKGGWWYNRCYTSHLNGLNQKGKEYGIVWGTYKDYDYSLYSEMKIKPTVS